MRERERERERERCAFYSGEQKQKCNGEINLFITISKLVGCKRDKERTYLYFKIRKGKMKCIHHLSGDEESEKPGKRMKYYTFR